MYGRLWIDGSWQESASGQRLDVRNPARPSEVVGTLASGTGQDIATAVAAARRAFPAWRDTPLEDRVARLGEAADRIIGLPDDVAALLTREMGKALWESRIDVGFAEYVLRFCSEVAHEAMAPLIIEDDDSGSVVVEKAPRGVAGAITPWNWPVGLLWIKLASALVTGNTVVAAPSPLASLAVLRTVEAVAELFPPGVVNVVTGVGSVVGSALVEHPDVPKISFTGSIATGQQIMRQAAGGIKALTLELGGNDPAILLDDVEITDDLAGSLATGAMITSGQICFAIKRIYVPNRLLPNLVEAYSAALSSYVVGDGLADDTTIGPVASDTQLKRFRSYLDEARQRGASVTEHGTLSPAAEPEGYFHLPTVVTGADESFSIVADEQFGPATPIIGYDTVDEAVARANDSVFGLKSSVWSADRDRALAVARRLEAGTTFINQHSPFAVDIRAPLGGFKHSGIGREFGLAGLEAYVEMHQINSRSIT
jgi:aldehyde dehydrogenase